MKVKEVAELVGISVRTLHHYDDIGLLEPEETTEAGYRMYSEHDLEKLQQILFFRELGFPLKKIKQIMSSPSFNRQEALMLHHSMLMEKRSQLDRVIRTVEKTIAHAKGEIMMTSKEKFEGFDFSRNPYEQEARERWGDKAVDDSKAKLGKMDEATIKDEMNAIYTKLAALRHDSAQSDAAQAAIKEWYDFLNKLGSYSLDAFKGLGQMYVADERFTKNIDQFGEGLAQFMCDAMAAYSDKHQK